MKICTNCNKPKKYIHRRYKENLQGLLLCDSCYRKCLNICSMCKRHCVTYSYSEDNRVICETCATQNMRTCKSCGIEIPAGRGNICYKCSFFHTLIKKIDTLNLILSKYTNKVFESFTWWFYNRRDIIFVSTKIQKYFILFYKLDILANELNRFPQYDEILNFLDNKIIRKYTLVMIFLNEKNYINIDIKTKEKYSNLNLIEKYLTTFSENTYEYFIINRYSKYLFNKFEKKETSIRSIRLALTPAVKLLKYKEYFNAKLITNDIINGYIWIYPGQTASLTGFINFLIKEDIYNIYQIKQTTIKFEHPKESKCQLKLRLIKLLRKKTFTKKDKLQILKTSIEYFHYIKIPKNVYLSINNLTTFNNITYIKCHKDLFYIPKEIIDKLI